MEKEKTIVAQMQTKRMQAWSKPEKKKLVFRPVFLYACIALGGAVIGIGLFSSESMQDVSVMNHLNTGFEYDETLGSIQYVSNILPDSAMVFLSKSNENASFSQPVNEEFIIHAWSQSEPWIEYENAGSILACQSGEVATVIKNRMNEYTVRILHDDGYESVYSGLNDVAIKENDIVAAGSEIGFAARHAAFELRRDGLSILPVF